jgi:hypothetical protein
VATTSFATPAAAQQVFWTDWHSVVFENGVTKYVGTLTVTRPNGQVVPINVKFSAPRGIGFFQTDSSQFPLDYFSDWDRQRNPSTSPYTSADEPTIPPAHEMLGLMFAQKNTLEFSRAIGNPLFSFGDCIPVRLGDYNLFLLGSYSGGHDVQGKVAAGGDIHMTDFAVGAGLPSSDTVGVLVAGGQLALSRGAVFGEAWYGGSYSGDSSVTYARGGVSPGTPIDFATYGYGFQGTVLAPSADITFSNGSFDGGIYAKSLTGNAEGHLRPLHDRDLCPAAAP